MSERGKTDWAAVRQAFISSRLSHRAVAARFGLAHTTVYRKARAEGWDKQRLEYATTLLRTQAEEEARRQAEGLSHCIRVADTILGRLESLLCEPQLQPHDLRCCSGTVKDVAAILMSDLDRERKLAELEVLRRKVNGSPGQDTIRVVIDGGQGYAL